jgi:hypothetical protein
MERMCSHFHLFVPNRPDTGGTVVDRLEHPFRLSGITTVRRKIHTLEFKQ